MTFQRIGIRMLTLVSCLAAPVAARADAGTRILEDAFSRAVRNALQRELGTMRQNYSNGWGRTARVWTGETKVEFQGIHSKAVRIYRNRNDGLWVRGWAELTSPRDFNLQFRNVRRTPGKLEVRFQTYATGQFRAWAQARQYTAGQKLFDVDASGRARLHLYVNMRVWIYDNGTRLGWEAESVDFKYSNVRLDRVGKLGGVGARALGDGVRGAIDQWFPQGERAAVAKVKQAVHSALSGSRDVRNDIARFVRQ